MNRISKEHLNYVLDEAIEPALRVALPARLTYETIDAFGGQVKSERDRIEALDFNKVNPATGPVAFEGVEPGDVLAIHIEDLRVPDRGVMMVEPGAGLLKDLYESAELKLLPIKGGSFFFDDLALPLNPMIGVIGLAPKGKGIGCGSPGPHGGNMDTKLIAKGATLYLPAQVKGGLLSMGDLHAAMGDGEICVTGIEIDGEVDVYVTKAAGLRLTTPVIKNSEKLAFIYSAASLELAARGATLAMAEFLMERTGLSFNKATMLLSAIGNLEISQVVDPLVTTRMSLPLDVLRQLGVKVDF